MKSCQWIALKECRRLDLWPPEPRIFAIDLNWTKSILCDQDTEISKAFWSIWRSLAVSHGFRRKVSKYSKCKALKCDSCANFITQNVFILDRSHTELQSCITHPKPIPMPRNGSPGKGVWADQMWWRNCWCVLLGYYQCAVRYMLMIICISYNTKGYLI